jgi:serine/threonine-protein kinase
LQSDGPSAIISLTDTRLDLVHPLFDTLMQLTILTPDRVKELGPSQGGGASGGPELLDVVRRRGWLTNHQYELLKAARARELQLGPYLILEPIRSGGMGDVLKARHLQLDRLAAIKLISSDHLQSPDTLARFQREARAAARLLHPNVVIVFDAGQDGDRHFYAMEYVSGIDLKQLLQQHGALSAQRACFYVRQAALGLEHAHQQGLVHRDIKPSNLILTPWPQETGNPGVVKVLDFGLARLTSQLAADRLTAAGQIMGTPDYIAPEQVLNSSSVDIRADIYSLGGTLFTLLTARVPFPSKSVQKKVFSRLGRAAPRITELRPELPTVLADVVAKMMAVEPANRFASPLEVADALAQFTGEPMSSSLINLPPLMPLDPLGDQSTTDFLPLTGSPKRSAPVKARRWSRRVFAAAAAIVVLATLGAALGMALAR